MNDSQRIAELIDLLELLYQKLSAFEKELIISDSVSKKFELKQQIKREILPNIRTYEAEYWSRYPVESIVISEQEAAQHLYQVENAVTTMEQASASSYPTALVPLLEEIRDRLNEDKSASAKLKLALPLVPAIATYEVELETSKAMQQAWNSLKNWIRN